MKWEYIRKIGNVGNMRNINLEIIRNYWKYKNLENRKWKIIKKIGTMEI